MANYTLHTWANGFGQWFCLIEFPGMGLGNSGIAERIAANAIMAAKRRIRAEIAERMATKPKRLTYAVAENKLCACGCNRLQALVITENEKKGNKK